MQRTYQDALGNTTIILEYHETCNFMHASFLSVQSSGTIRKAAGEMLAFAAERKCRKYLSDNTWLVGGKEIDNNWIADEFIPKAIAAGIRQIAYVLPPKAKNIQSVAELELDLPAELSIMFFDDVEDARQWLILQ